MIKATNLFALGLLLLAACGQGDQQSKSFRTSAVGSVMADKASRAAPEAPPPPGQPGENAPKLAYSHSVALEMAADKVAPRYERARDACLGKAEFGCTLVHASISVGDEASGTPPYAALTVRLPHDKIAAFQSELLSPLSGEKQGEPVLRSSTTDAEDLTYVIMDADRRLKQLTDYRDRLTELAKRPGAEVEDLIRIEAKISETQSAIEALSAEQRQLNLRVDTEILSISLSALAGIADVRSPLAEAWRNAGQVLGNSAAEAFTFTVSALPWLPLIALLLWLALRLWRLIRGKGWRKPRETAATS